jgi:uncharacterized membrane protein YfcA
MAFFILHSVSQRHARLAFFYAVPIALLGGLIGLGGAEFRLPVLVRPLGYVARKAVPLNLAVSLVTILTAFLIRGRTLSLTPVLTLWPFITALIAGAVVAAFLGTALVHKVTNEQLERVILVFLVIIGLTLITEAFLPQAIPGLLPDSLFWRVGAGLGCGLMIGLVSSMLGVAGGELIIPTLIFAFGVEVKTAGTASLLISLPIVLVGVMRYAKQGAYGNRQSLRDTVAPMGVGSVIGAVIGGLLAGVVPSELLKVFLGLILVISAIRIFYKR